jgi:hypothetical protein
VPDSCQDYPSKGADSGPSRLDLGGQTFYIFRVACASGLASDALAYQRGNVVYFCTHCLSNWRGRICKLGLDLGVIHAFEQLRAIARANLYELPVYEQERDYLVRVECVKNFIILFIKFLQRLNIPVGSFFANELDIVACVFCAGKADSRNVQVLFIMAGTLLLDKPLPPAKIAKRVDNASALCGAKGAKAGTHEKDKRLATGPFQWLVSYVHEFPQNLLWNETAHRQESLALVILMF